MFLGILAAIALGVGVTQTAIEVHQAEQMAQVQSAPIVAMAEQAADE